MENPTHDVIPPPTFDKAWQRKEHHAAERYRLLGHAAYMYRIKKERELAKDIEDLKAGKALKPHKPKPKPKTTPDGWITYEEAAAMLGYHISHIYRLAKYGSIQADTKRRLMSKGSVEVCRDTRTR